MKTLPASGPMRATAFSGEAVMFRVQLVPIKTEAEFHD
jgi:hypothetical protein